MAPAKAGQGRWAGFRGSDVCDALVTLVRNARLERICRSHSVPAVASVFPGRARLGWQFGGTKTPLTSPGACFSESHSRSPWWVTYPGRNLLPNLWADGLCGSLTVVPNPFRLNVLVRKVRTAND